MSDATISPLPLSLPPRGLSRPQAAAVVGVSVGTFDVMVNDGRMPRPKRIGTRKLWDRVRVEEAFVELPEEGGGHENPCDAIFDR